MKRMLYSTALLCILCMAGLMYACTKPSAATAGDVRDQLAGKYIGPDTTFADTGIVAISIETLTVSKSDEVATGLLIDSEFHYMEVQADSSILCIYGNDKLPSDNYYLTFYPTQQRLAYRIEIHYLHDSVQVTHRSILTRQ